MAASILYLRYVAAVSIFRVIVYFVDLDSVSKAKVKKEAWEDPNIREITRAYCAVVRMMMGLRSAICLWALFLQDGTQKDNFCLINVAFDLHLMYNVIKSSWLKSLVLAPQTDAVVFFIQGSLSLAGLGYLVYWIMSE